MSIKLVVHTNGPASGGTSGWTCEWDASLPAEGAFSGIFLDSEDHIVIVSRQLGDGTPEFDPESLGTTFTDYTALGVTLELLQEFGRPDTAFGDVSYGSADGLPPYTTLVDAILVYEDEELVFGTMDGDPPSEETPTMSLIIANADATSPVVPSVPGSQKQAVVKITFDSSYPTGGEIITPASVGLLQIDAVICNSLTSGGRLVIPVLASGVWKLKVLVSPAAAAHTHTAPAITIASHVHVENADALYTQSANTAGTVATATSAAIASGGAISAGGLSELADTTNIATDTVFALVIGT